MGLGGPGRAPRWGGSGSVRPLCSEQRLRVPGAARQRPSLSARPVPTPALLRGSVPLSDPSLSWHTASGRRLSPRSSSPDFASRGSALELCWPCCLTPDSCFMQLKSEHQRCLRKLLANADRCTGYPSGELPEHLGFIPTFMSGQNTRCPKEMLISKEEGPAVTDESSNGPAGNKGVQQHL